MSRTLETGLVYPYPEAPPPGTVTEVAPGVLWLRLPLPFALDHVNVEFGRGQMTSIICDVVSSGALRQLPIEGCLGGEC